MLKSYKLLSSEEIKQYIKNNINLMQVSVVNDQVDKDTELEIESGKLCRQTMFFFTGRGLAPWPGLQLIWSISRGLKRRRLTKAFLRQA